MMDVNLEDYPKQTHYCQHVCVKACVGWLDCPVVKRSHPEFNVQEDEVKLQ